MSKPVLYYAIVNVYQHKVMSVTSEGNGQIFGSIDNVGTHLRKDMVLANYETYEEAENTRLKITNVINEYASHYKDLNTQMNNLHKKEYQEIRDILNG